MAYGVTSTGFVIKPLDTIESEVEASLKTELGAYVNTLPSSVLGNLKSLFAEREHSLWQLAQAVYAAGFFDSATGQSLDNLGALVGAKRLSASKSTVTLTVTLDATTTLATGAQVRIPNTTVTFETLADVTSTTAGDYTVAAQALETGPKTAGAGTLTDIVNAQTGWTASTNVAAAVAGRDLETDADFKIRIKQLLRAQGEATLAAMRGDLIDLEGVTEVKVNNNPTNAEVDTVPAKAFEVVIRGGDDNEIAAEILDSTPLGTEMHGTTTVATLDDEGVSVDVKFTRPTATPLYMAITIQTGDAWNGASSESEIKTRLSNEVSTFLIGEDVYASRLIDEVFATAGVIDVSPIYVGTSASPVTSSVSIGARAYAQLDVANITIVTT